MPVAEEGRSVLFINYYLFSMFHQIIHISYFDSKKNSKIKQKRTCCEAVNYI